MIPLHSDPEEIIRFVRLLAEPGQVVELRILKVRRGGQGFPRTVSGYFTDYEALAREACKFGTGAGGVYVSLNPVNPDLLARSANKTQETTKDTPLTSDVNIASRRWLPIDIDPTRASGISSTDEEHQIAIERAQQIRETLHVEGWPRPLFADSGNGAHLLYRIELPADDGGLIERCLESLALRFDDDRATVDQLVFNPSRIWKLYGTVSRKGNSLPDRPHRLARILELP